jgi:hypothetical protein
MDIEKSITDWKETSPKQRMHVGGQVLGGLIGGRVGGYPGMMIGMAIGGFLFKPDSPNKKDYNNPDYKTSKARIDSVPDVIGTDICPGKVIYFNKHTFELYDSGHLPSMEGSVNKAAWAEFIDSINSENKVAFWTEYAVNFCGKYYQPNHIGVIKFNGKPFWFWLIFSDQWENYDDPLNPYPPLTVLDASKIEYYQNIDVEELIGQDINFNHIMYFKGFFADFTAASVVPATSNLQIDLNLLADIKPEQLPAMLSAMPIFTAEVNSDAVWLSPESMHGGEGMPSSTSYGNFDWWWENYGQYGIPGYNHLIYGYSIYMGKYWSCRDAKNNYFVGLMESGELVYPIAMEGSDRQWDFCIDDYDRLEYDDDKEVIHSYLQNNITKGGWQNNELTEGGNVGYLQSTDVHDNRVYICAHSNWHNPHQGIGVYYTDKIEHHHAEFGVLFDLYYHDRSDPNQKVHSLIYQQKYDHPEDYKEGCNPSLHFGSMQVDADYIYIFGSRNQTDIVLTDKRQIVAGENSYTKIYADFSQYDSGFWVGYYAALGQNQYKLWREIIEQTSTYIVVAKEFAAFPVEGEMVGLSKYPQWVSDWGIVGEGSTTTKIICNAPTWNIDNWLDGEHSGLTRWNHIFYIGKWLYGVEISSIVGTVINLASPLDREPIPGERINFSMISSVDFDEFYTDPNMSDEYMSTFYYDLGFDSWPAKDDLGNLNVSRISANEFNRSHHICWRIDKSTGSMEVFDTQRLTTPTYYVGPALTYTGGVSVYTCATDVSAFVYSHEDQYGTQMAAYSYVIVFGSGIKEQIHRRNNYATGWAPVWCYMGCVPVREWDEDTQDWVNVWYTLLRSFDSGEGLNEAIGQGTHFLRLNDGIFSNDQVYFDNINGYFGLNLGDNIDQVLYRKIIATGPLYMAMWIESYPNENTYQIGKFGITEDIYFGVLKIAGLMGTGIGFLSEMWRYTPPTEVDPAGELYCIGKSALWDADKHSPSGGGDDLEFQWLEIPYYGNFKQCRYGFYGTNESGRWYQCDASPPDVILDFFKGYTDPSYVESGFYLRFNIDEAKEICNEIIDTTLYTIKENIPLRERRFQFSQCYDQPKKFYDVLNEVLDTCQGFISPCIWEDSKYKLMIPNSSERPVYYFGKGSAVFVSTQLSDDSYYIYGNFSAYPDNYWKGDMVYFSGMNRDWSIVLEQTSTYIVIGDSLSPLFPVSKEFTLKKDNMKEGSFTFAEKSAMDRPNKVRIEFKNRLLDYIKDVAEAEDTYRLDILGETEKIDHYKMHGIKRATQAGRMALRILDQWNYQRLVCAFETDVMGMTLCMGEIIGVSHEITGWNGKWFRIVAMEELMDFEVRFELEEFNPYCYHDEGVPVFQGYSYSGFPTPYVPRNVERLEVKEDIEFNRLYFTFKEPSRDAGFFIGARIYRKTGTDTWEFITIINETVSSVKLAQDVELDDTTIYYDNDTVSGSFPSQGVIWIENELMYYHGIDTTNYAFTHVVRGYKDTDQVEHSIDNNNLYITLRDDVTDYLEIPEEWAGTTQTFKISSTTIHFLTISLDISPSVSIDIIGHGVLPYFPESIQNKLPEFENIFESLGLSEDTIELTIEQIVEILGLGDTNLITESLAQLIETLGLGDTKTVTETLTKLIETLGLGDDEYDPDA